MKNNRENFYYKPKELQTTKLQISNLNSETISDINNNPKGKEKLFIKIFIAIIFFGLIIGIEQAYREDLFYKSIDVQEDIRNDYDKGSTFYGFWKFMSYFGVSNVTFPIFAIIFLFLPLNSSFLTLQVLIYSIYITNVLKIIYRNGRPYWQSTLLDIVCNSGYGNPSGHSVTATTYYLTLPHILTNFEFFKKDTRGKILRIVIFLLFMILGALVMISRIILGAHSLNQVIYGFSLGLGVYFISIYILSYHTYNHDTFISHITNCVVVFIYMIFHLILLALLIIMYFALEDNQKIKYKIEIDIFNGQRCKVKKKYLMLKHDGFFQGLALTSIIGAHLGIILLNFFLKKYNYVINRYITEFNRSSVKRWIIRLPILIFSGIFMLLNFTIPGGSPLSIIFIFKSSLSFFFTNVGIFFVGIFISIHCNLANENITKIF